MSADLPCVPIRLASTVHPGGAPAIVPIGDAFGVNRGAGAVGLALVLEGKYAFVSIPCRTF